jgi:arsenate reductase
MREGTGERRLSSRTKAPERVCVRPADPRHAKRTCGVANQSQAGFYFITKLGNYAPGMDVFVTRNYSPNNPAQREEKAVVVRVESLGGGHVGIAIQMGSVLPKRVLFVCIGNSCRSPMAEAIAQHLAPDVIEASSAGLAPLGYISPATRTVLTEIGISSARQQSKALRESDVAQAHLLINMAGRPVEHLFHASTPVEYWDVADPFGNDLASYRRARDEIHRRVTELAKRLRDGALRVEPARG